MIFNYLSHKSGQRSDASWSVAVALVCASLIFNPIQAQTPHCHADEMLSDYIGSHEIQHEIQQYKNNLKGQVATRSGAVIELPVVFHIIHQGEPLGQGSNFFDSKIMEQLHILNTDFALQNTDKDNIPQQFAGQAADTEIQFCLAQVDENDQATSGIIRHQMENITGINYIENVVKPSTQWDPNKYINIWIVRMHDPAILGYALLPMQNVLGTVRDGIVVSHFKIGNQSTSTRGRTLVHEMGHYLGLLHMWGFNEEDCDEDDQVSDTPDTFAPNYGCPAHPQFTCGTADMFMNYMDYVDDNCMFMFTEGQKSIMHSVLDNQRLSLRANKDAICNNTTVSTSEEDIVVLSLDLYPNPCTDYINVDTGSEYEIVSYQIFTMSGRLVQQIDRLNRSVDDLIRISTNSFSNGAYIVRFETKSGESVTKRFVKVNN